jgi:hypothetical protein
MKRKVKKFNEGGETKYNREDEGILGGKINYREEDGRKYVAGKATPFDRNPSEQRYYSMDDVKGKLSGLFGGKKEAPKSVDSEPVGDANKSSSYYKSEEEPRRQMTDRMTNKPEPAGKTFLRQEADIDEKPAKKVVAKKVVAKKVEPKASQDSGFPKDTKSTRMPSNSGSRFKGRSENPIQSTIDSATKTLDRRTNEQKMADRVRFVAEGRKKEKADELGYGIKKGGMVKKMASGGSVKSASARADGCAIRGKTRA